MKKQMMTNLDYPDAFGAKQLRARGPLLALLLATTVIAALAFPSLANAGETSAADDAGFSISVDGEQVAGNKTIASEQSGSDVTLENVDIQIKFDGLDTKPRLNVSTTDLRRTYQGGEALHFIASSNYPAWISRSELRIFDQSKAAGAKPIAIVAVGTNGQATWNMPDEGDGNYIYVLRVYDHKNRFDETKPLTLSRSRLR